MAAQNLPREKEKKPEVSRGDTREFTHRESLAKRRVAKDSIFKRNPRETRTGKRGTRAIDLSTDRWSKGAYQKNRRSPRRDIFRGGVRTSVTSDRLARRKHLDPIFFPSILERIWVLLGGRACRSIRVNNSNATRTPRSSWRVEEENERGTTVRRIEASIRDLAFCANVYRWPAAREPTCSRYDRLG